MTGTVNGLTTKKVMDSSLIPKEMMYLYTTQDS